MIIIAQNEKAASQDSQIFHVNWDAMHLRTAFDFKDLVKIYLVKFFWSPGKLKKHDDLVAESHLR